MWILKTVIPSDKSTLVGSIAKKHNLSVMGYPLSHFRKNGKFYLFGTFYLTGNIKIKNAFLRDLKKDKRTKKVDRINENFGYWLMEQHSSSEIFYNPLIIYPKPLFVSSNGDYIFEMASWDRKILENIAERVESSVFNGKVVYFKKGKIENIQVISMIPNLTEKQKKALELAIQYGYYGYPRKTGIEIMAKLMRVSYSTFQFHLRNAEKKIIPYIAKVSE